MHISKRKVTFLLAALTITISCKLSAAEHKKKITGHSHYNGQFPNPGLFLALQKFMMQPAKEKPASKKFDDNAFANQVTQSILDLPLIVEREQS